MKTAVCTIGSNNYLHFARTLMQTLERAHPDWDRWLLLADENYGFFDPAAERFNVVPLAELPIPNRRSFCFRYTILELNTAVKPWIIEHLFETRGYDRVIYFDPDILVYRPLDEVVRLLDSGAFMVLTPHLTGELNDDLKPSELEILRAGTYNLGFVALARHDNTLPFLKWWQSKVEYDCVVDFENGLFVDQKWMDLAPGMWSDVALLRHPGYNAAYWNLKHRTVTREGGGYRVNGEPLVFFHFSGMDPLKPGPFSKHQDRYSLSNLGPVRRLAEDYCARVIANGLETCRQWPYAFGRFTDGTDVVDEMRYWFRKHLEPERPGDIANPFDLGHAYFHRPWGASGPDRPLVTLLMRAIWETNKYLQEHFHDLDGAGRANYAYWFCEEVADDFDVPTCCTDLVRQSLQEPAGKRPRKASAWNPFRLMRWARKLLPRRTQRRMYELVHPVPGHMTRKPGLLRRIARRLPSGMKRRIKAVLKPKPSSAPETIPAAGKRHATTRRWGHSGLYYLGFYDEEPDVASTGLAWMGADASVRVLKPRPGTLRVTGEYAPDFFVQSGLNPKTTLRVRLGGRLLGETPLERAGRFELAVPFPADGSRGVTVVLAADQAFVPAEIGLGQDRRKLSLRVARVALDDTVLLDFSQAPDSFMPGADILVGPFGFNLIGYLRSELGVGESARLCAAAADAVAIPYAPIDFTVGCNSRADDSRLSHLLTDENPHPVNLFHINADQMPVVYSCLGERFFADHYNVGFWHWELGEFPDEWLPSFNALQEVWVPTRFVQDAVGAKSPVPVVRMPHAIAFSVPENLRRADMQLPDRKFLFLMMYDMHSFQSRKNPEAVLEAYRRAFAQSRRDDVGLVIKTMNTQTYPDEWAPLEERLRDVPGVVVINRTLSRQEVYNLEALCDCFASLHRSEGFGLGLAESMFLGKPAIGTNWSGNVDFMDETNSCPVKYRLVELDRDYGPYKKGQRWADADVDHAAWCMRKIVEDVAFRGRIAEAGRATLRTHFSRKAVGELYRKRLDVIARLL